MKKYDANKQFENENGWSVIRNSNADNEVGPSGIRNLKCRTLNRSVRDPVRIWKAWYPKLCLYLRAHTIYLFLMHVDLCFKHDYHLTVQMTPSGSSTWGSSSSNRNAFHNQAMAIDRQFNYQRPWIGNILAIAIESWAGNPFHGEVVFMAVSKVLLANGKNDHCLHPIIITK